MASDTAILIPARMASSRFPNKMLADLNGKSLIRTVYDKCKESGLPTFVLTDSAEIRSEVKSAIITPDADNGTARCSYGMHNLPPFDYYINVQGDMPDITVDIISAVRKKLKHYSVTTAYTEMSPKLRRDPNTVKLIHNRDSAHWFCRASLEYGDHHLGVYGYSHDMLGMYNLIQKHHAEEHEDLEQLRWLQNGVRIGITKVKFGGIEINTASDLTLWQRTNRSMS